MLCLTDSLLYEVVPPAVHGTHNDDTKDANGGEDNWDGDGEHVQLGLTELGCNFLKRVDDAEIRNLTWHSSDGGEEGLHGEDEDQVRIFCLASLHLNRLVCVRPGG